jgi:hypothetical protein
MIPRLPLSIFIFRTCFLLAVILVLATPLVRAQALGWQSAVSLGEENINAPSIGQLNLCRVSTSVPDGQGNLYVAGSFNGHVAFGSTTLTSTLVPGRPDYNYDLFVAKWSLRDKRYLWAVSTSGTGGESVHHLVVSGANLYLTGETIGRISQPGTFTVGTTTYPTTGTYQVYVAKLTDTGTTGVWRWGKLSKNTAPGGVCGLGVNGNSVYIAGDFSADFTFDTKLITRYVAASSDLGNLYIAKFTDAGNSASLGWLQQLQASTSSEANAFAVYGTSLYLTGTYTSASSTMANTRLPNLGRVPYQDVFVAKYTEVGTGAQAIWAQHIGGTQEDEVSALQVSGAAIYLTGNYASPTLQVGETKTVANPEPADFTSNVYLAKLTDAGTSSSFDWAQSVGSTQTQNRQVAQLLRVGTAIYLAGRFYGPTATFGNTVLQNTSPDGQQWDLYVTRFDESSTGVTLAWAQQAGSASFDQANSLNLIDNQLYLQGYANEAITFGTTTLPKGSSFLTTLLPNRPLASATTTALTALGVYPNPAHTNATVRVPAIAGATQATLTLQDALGRTVYTATMPLSATGGMQELNLTSLRAGVYALQVQAGASTTVRRLVVE